MERKVIFVVLAFFIINAPSVRAGMTNLTAGNSDVSDYAVFSRMGEQTTGTNGINSFVSIPNGAMQCRNIGHHHRPGNKIQLNEDRNADNNHSLLLSDVTLANLLVCSV